MEWTVTGPFVVAGIAPGGTVTASMLEGTNVDHLVAAGHLTPTARPVKADKATNPEE